MSILGVQPRFQSKFIYQKKDLNKAPGAREKIQTWTPPFPSSTLPEGQFALQISTDTPKPGDLTLEVNVENPEKRTAVQQDVFWKVQLLGIPVRFEPDKPITKKEKKEAATRLLTHVITAMKAASPNGKPEFTPKIRNNGDYLQILSQDGNEDWELKGVIKTLIKQKILLEERSSMGYSELWFGKFPVSIIRDPKSRHQINMND